MNFHFHFSTFKKEKYFARRSSKIMVPLTNTKNGFHSSLGAGSDLGGEKKFITFPRRLDTTLALYCTSLTD